MAFFNDFGYRVAGFGGFGQRRLGNPRTDRERIIRHKARYGTSELPPRGTGLRGPVYVRR